LDLADKVRLLGFVPAESYRDYVAAADICLNLRHPTAGETSASLLRMMGAGKPVLVSRTGSFTELPDDCCGKIDIDESEEDLLLEYLLFLAENPEAREQMGRNAREYVAREHNMAVATEGYFRFLSQLLGLPLDPKFTLQDKSAVEANPQNVDIMSLGEPGSITTVASEASPDDGATLSEIPEDEPPIGELERPAVESTLPGWPRGHLASTTRDSEPDPEPEEWSLLAEVASHAADLGITEYDDVILKELARTVLDLEG
ncbi:MAG: hypothetical protein M1358_07210, partial [Chloroflexi bacterium]|nr:hypothetical protein [Chloroflexota bacterium]